MDHYPEVNVGERECASRRDSNNSSSNKASTQHPLDHKIQDGHHASPQYNSFPPASDNSNAELNQARNGSIDSTADEEGAKTQVIEADYAQYTDAPPPYSEKQYEGKSEEQQSKMRRADYSKELNRMMGKQLVTGLKTEAKTES